MRIHTSTIRRQDTVDSRQENSDSLKNLKIKTFQDLQVWKRAHSFALEIYKISYHFPKDELYGITSQIRRSSVSIPANIAEGFSRRSSLDKNHFYNIAQSSLHEVKYYLILIHDLGFIESKTKLWLQAEEISKMLHGLIESVKSNYAQK